MKSIEEIKQMIEEDAKKYSIAVSSIFISTLASMSAITVVVWRFLVNKNIGMSMVISLLLPVVVFTSLGLFSLLTAWVERSMREILRGIPDKKMVDEILEYLESKQKGV